MTTDYTPTGWQAALKLQLARIDPTEVRYTKPRRSFRDGFRAGYEGEEPSPPADAEVAPVWVWTAHDAYMLGYDYGEMMSDELHYSQNWDAIEAQEMTG